MHVVEPPFLLPSIILIDKGYLIAIVMRKHVSHELRHRFERYELHFVALENVLLNKLLQLLILHAFRDTHHDAPYRINEGQIRKGVLLFRAGVDVLKVFTNDFTRQTEDGAADMHVNKIRRNSRQPEAPRQYTKEITKRKKPEIESYCIPTIV